MLLAALALLLACRPASAQDEGGPLGQAAPAALDTAGLHLKKVWQLVRRTAPDAQLVQISGKVDASGAVMCSSLAPFQDGWRFTFYSPKTREYYLMAECKGAPAGPLKELRDTLATPLLPIEGAFLESDEALRVLAKRGISLDPAHYKLSPRRPFTLRLGAFDDPHFKHPKPVLWTVIIGRSSWQVDALKRCLFDPRHYGVDPEELLSEEEKAQLELNLKARPKKGRRNTTALADYEQVMAYAAKKHPGTELMAIEGFVDAWGGSPCLGPGDGWAYYFFHPKNKNMAVLFACKGDVGPGAASFIPVTQEANQPLGGRSVDSDVVIDQLIRKQPSVMNEGMGRNFTRHGTLRLLNYRQPPMSEPAFAEITQFWILELGNTRYTFDAKNARLLQMRE